MKSSHLPARIPEGTPVVLLHGLGRTRLAMFPLALWLKGRGYRPINVGYFGPAGLRRSLRVVTEALDAKLAPFRGGEVHFVTHSMGGIVARAYLAAREGLGGRFVQLAPPNQGATIANNVRRVPLLDRIPALTDLGRGARGAEHELPGEVEGYEVGVIAGRSVGPWLQGPNDGVVRVEETYLPCARDWILLEHFHTLVMNGRDTWRHTDAFFRTGRFDVDAPRLELGESGRVRLHRQLEPVA